MPICARTSEDLPEVYGAERQLHDPSTTVLFRPGRPQFASDTIKYQKPGHASPGICVDVVTKTVILVERADGIGVHSSIVVYRTLVTRLGPNAFGQSLLILV